MSNPTEPEPLDAEFEPADDDAAPTKVRKSGGIGGYLLTFLFASVVGGGIGGWIAWTLDEPDALSDVESRITALESAPAPAGFDSTGLEARLVALEASSLDSANIQTQLNDLEAALSETGQDPTLPGRVVALESAVEQAGVLANQALDQVGELGGGFNTEAIEARLAALEANGASAETDTDLSGLSARITALENATIANPVDLSPLLQRLDALENEATHNSSALESRLALLETRPAGPSDSEPAGPQNAERLAREVLALMALAEAVDSGQPYADQLENFERFADAETGVLSEYAATGILTLSMLARAFPAEAILETHESERVFFGLIEISSSSAAARRLREQVPLIEERLSLGDLNGAILLTGQLSESARVAAAEWLVSATARRQADMRLESLRMSMWVRQFETEVDPT